MVYGADLSELDVCRFANVKYLIVMFELLSPRKASCDRVALPSPY